MFTQLIHKFDLVWFSFKRKINNYFHFLLETLEMVLHRKDIREIAKS